MTADKPMANDAKVWRYMSFSRFIWLLQKKQLWLSRGDRLGDPWEISLAGNQLEHAISRHPISPITERLRPRETAMQRSERINKLWRQRTFVSCWNASDHESHALWRIYCGSSDGVALQTTFGKLRPSSLFIVVRKRSLRKSISNRAILGCEPPRAGRYRRR